MADLRIEADWKTPLSPFGLVASAGPFDGTRGFWASERTASGYVSLRGHPGDAAFLSAAARVIGGEVPLVPCSTTHHGNRHVLWVSPDEWLVIAPRAEIRELVEGLSTALQGIHSQIVDNCGGYTELEISGPRAREVLSHATVYNLSLLSDGRVVGTTFGKLTAFLRRDGEGYVLLFRRSFADYIWRFLVRAAEPYGLRIGVHQQERGQ